MNFIIIEIIRGQILWVGIRLLVERVLIKMFAVSDRNVLKMYSWYFSIL